MFLKPKHFIFECRPNFGSFYPLPGLLRAITFSAPKPPLLQISAYATGCDLFIHLFLLLVLSLIYPPDSQGSDGGANTYGKQLPRPEEI